MRRKSQTCGPHRWDERPTILRGWLAECPAVRASGDLCPHSLHARSQSTTKGPLALTYVVDPLTDRRADLLKHVFYHLVFVFLWPPKLVLLESRGKRGGGVEKWKKKRKEKDRSDRGRKDDCSQADDAGSRSAESKKPAVSARIPSSCLSAPQRRKKYLL